MMQDTHLKSRYLTVSAIILLVATLILLGLIAILASLAVMLPARRNFYETFGNIEPGDSELHLTESLKPTLFKCSQGEITYYIARPIDPSPLVYEVRHGEVKAISFNKDNEAYKIMFGKKDRISLIENRYGKPTQKLVHQGITYSYYHRLRLYADETPVVLMSIEDAVFGARLISKHAHLYPKPESEKRCLSDYYKIGKHSSYELY